MHYDNLRQLLQRFEQAGQLKRIAAEVDPELEITEIADRMVKDDGPVLWFENVRGSSLPLVINTFAARQRMAWALGVDNCDEIGQRIRQLLMPRQSAGIINKLRGLADLAELSSYTPRMVDRAPCQQIVLQGDEASLDDLPVLKCWPEDGGRFITLGAVYTRPPDGGPLNAGMYRLQIYDPQTAGMHIHAHHDGWRHYRQWEDADRDMPAAIVLGGDPATIYAATAPMPPAMNELLLAGFIRRKAVDLVQCRTIDMQVPAQAEIVIEGYVPRKQRRTEGPFGDHTGYYSLQGDYPIFKVTAVTRRTDAVYPTTVVGRPPMEDCYLGKATERIFLPMLQTILPEVVDYDLPLFGVFHNFVFVSIRKAYAFHARKVMHALWGMGQMMLTKFIIVVDDDTDVHNVDEVMWRVGNNVDPERDVEMTHGPLDALDHAAPQPLAGSKMGIDATRKWTGEGHVRPWPRDIRMSREIIDRVTRRWKEYGFADPQ